MDRARRVRKEHAEFFERYRPEAREVLEELLDKYADHGIGELDDMGVLQVPPFADLGSPIEIAGRFGGGQALREAISALRDLLYVA
jgi:type I restriction enzyme R subunit